MAAFRALEDRPKSFHIVTYGCQMNAHDSEKLSGMLTEWGCARRRTAGMPIL